MQHKPLLLASSNWILWRLALILLLGFPINSLKISNMYRILVTKRNTLQLLNNCSRILSILLKDLIVNRKKAIKINGNIAMKSGITIQLPNRLLIISTIIKIEYIMKST